LPRAQLQKEEKAPKQATFVELESLNDLARLTCALERAPLPTFANGADTHYRLSSQIDFFSGSAVFYFSESSVTRQFLGYKTTSSGEEVSLVDIPSNPSFVYSPIIEIVKFPKVFQPQHAKHKGPKYQSVELRDLASLIKIATYKVIFEEPPLPVFAFPINDEKWRLGTFARIEDFEEASLFFYLDQYHRPAENFVGYSTSKSLAYFTNRTDEHGNMFVKVIRLKATHPLVDID
jgi:hypothetical protein